MKIRIELYGTLRKTFNGDRNLKGLDLEIANGSRAMELLKRLNIKDQQCVVIT